MTDEQQQQNDNPPNPVTLASGSVTATKVAMKEALTELFSKVPGLKELMEKPSTVPPPSLNQGQQKDQTKRKQRLYLAEYNEYRSYSHRSLAL